MTRQKPAKQPLPKKPTATASAKIPPISVTTPMKPVLDQVQLQAALGYLARVGSELFDDRYDSARMQRLHRARKTVPKLRPLLNEITRMKAEREQASQMASIGELANLIAVSIEEVKAVQNMNEEQRKSRLRASIQMLAEAHRISPTDEQLQDLLVVVGGHKKALKSAIKDHLGDWLERSGATVDKAARVMGSSTAREPQGFVRDQKSGRDQDFDEEDPDRAAAYGVLALVRAYGRQAVVDAINSLDPLEMGPKGQRHAR